MTRYGNIVCKMEVYDFSKNKLGLILWFVNPCSDSIYSFKLFLRIFKKIFELKTEDLRLGS